MSMNEPWFGVFAPADADEPVACFGDAEQAKRWRNSTYGKAAAIREVIVAALEPGKQATAIAALIDPASIKDTERLLVPGPATAKAEPEAPRTAREPERRGPPRAATTGVVAPAAPAPPDGKESRRGHR